MSERDDDRLLADALRTLLANVYVWWPDDESLGVDGMTTLSPEQAAAVTRALDSA